MWLCTLVLLWMVPVLAYRRARSVGSSHTFCAAGIALGIVASPASFGTYGLYWLASGLGLVAMPLAFIGILGLPLTLLHSAPGFFLATSLGLVNPEAVTGGVGIAYMEFLDAVVWATVYGMLGYAVDFLIQRQIQNRTPPNGRSEAPAPPVPLS